MELFKVNPDFSARISHVGNEQTPIIIIDDFAVDTTLLKAHAVDNLEFGLHANTYYPGIRAIPPTAYIKESLQSLIHGLYKVFNIPKALTVKPQLCYYSLITSKPEELALMQRMPHFDTPQPYYLAILHYLNDKPHGDTGLFRHKQTGFERITADRQQTYFDALKAHVSATGEPQAKYCTESNDCFELYHTIEYKPNRLVIYPGNLLHSTIVDVDHDIDTNPLTGRLTGNIFVDFV